MVFSRLRSYPLLTTTWWLMLLRGLAAIVFGILTWWMPTVTLNVLIALFGAYVLIDGIIGIVTAIGERKERRTWWLLLLWGLIGVIVAMVAFFEPGTTAVALVYVIAFWALFTGALQILTAFRLRHVASGQWLLMAAAALTLLFGILLVVNPQAGALALLWLLASYCVLFGIVLIVLALQLRRALAHHEARHTT